MSKCKFCKIDIEKEAGKNGLSVHIGASWERPVKLKKIDFLKIFFSKKAKALTFFQILVNFSDFLKVYDILRSNTFRNERILQNSQKRRSYGVLKIKHFRKIYTLKAPCMF